jgi:hypothetical protein
VVKEGEMIAEVADNVTIAGAVETVTTVAVAEEVVAENAGIGETNL